MMGSRGKNYGFEDAAFSKGQRRIYHWGRGELKKLKRAFQRRARRAFRLTDRRDADASGTALRE